MDGHYMPLSYHARLVGDVWRMEAYDRALRQLVRPNDVVLDVGAGSGVLSLMAARRGARVHAVESTEVAELAQALVAAHGSSITVHRGDITKLAPVESVDLVVSDFMGCFLVDDGMLAAIGAAAAWSRPDTRWCPSEVRLFVAPVADMTLPSVDVWLERPLGLDLSLAAERALGQCLPGNLPPSALVAAPQLFATFRPPGPAPRFDRALSFVSDRAGRVRALAGWFEADLAPGVVLTTAPGFETHWGQQLFPVPAQSIERGESIEVRLRLEEQRWHWDGAIGTRAFAIRGSDVQS